MFSKLKEKLKSWTKKVSEETKEKVEKPKKEEAEIDYSIDEKLKKEVQKEKYKEPSTKLDNSLQITPKIEDSLLGKNLGKGLENIEKEPKKEKKNFFSSKKEITEKDFESHADELEMILLENNVALEVVEKIINNLKEKIVGKNLIKKEIGVTIAEALKEIIHEVLVEPFDIIKEIKEKKEKPYVILFCGINGTGKTTHIAKLANLFEKEKIGAVLAAGDTFRAAAVEQLKTHGEKLKVKVIANEYGADPASVGFDAIKYAKKNNVDVVLIDTAGRIHTATNLIREMEKIKRVTKPDRTIFVGEAITGNDSTDQVKAFNDAIGIDAIILSKSDIDEKGGTALSLGYTTKKPLLYLGTGQGYNDLEKFDKNKFIEKLGLD